MTPLRLLTLLGCAVVLAACGGSGPSTDPATTTTPTPAPTAPAPTATPTPAGTAADTPEALDFVAPALDGGQVRGADYAGQDVVLWMWAPW